MYMYYIGIIYIHTHTRTYIMITCIMMCCVYIASAGRCRLSAKQYSHVTVEIIDQYSLSLVVAIKPSLAFANQF